MKFKVGTLVKLNPKFANFGKGWLSTAEDIDTRDIAEDIAECVKLAPTKLTSVTLWVVWFPRIKRTAEIAEDFLLFYN